VAIKFLGAASRQDQMLRDTLPRPYLGCSHSSLSGAVVRMHVGPGACGRWIAQGALVKSTSVVRCVFWTMSLYDKFIDLASH